MSEFEKAVTGLGEECGVFGAYDVDGHDVAASVYYGLFALQHRGQESCGIAAPAPAIDEESYAVLLAAVSEEARLSGEQFRVTSIKEL